MASSKKPRTCAEAEAQIEAEANRAAELGEIFETFGAVATRADEAVDVARGAMDHARELWRRVRNGGSTYRLDPSDLAGLTASLVGLLEGVMQVRNEAVKATEHARAVAKAAGYDDERGPVPF